MDTTTQFMLEIALITIIAGVCSVVFTKLRFPAVIGYIVAGMLLGPTIIGGFVYFDTAVIDFLANIGIALLMFSIGLDFNLRRLKKIGGFAILGRNGGSGADDAPRLQPGLGPGARQH